MLVTGPAGTPETLAHVTICGALAKWPWASMNDGIRTSARRVRRSRCPRPRVDMTSASSPTARMRPPPMATASTRGRASSIVRIVPPRKIRSALVVDHDRTVAIGRARGMGSHEFHRERGGRPDIIAVMDDDRLYGMLTRLIALSPEGDAGRNALVRRCARHAVSLPPLPARARGRRRPGARRVRRAVRRRRVGGQSRAARGLHDGAGRQGIPHGGADLHRRLRAAGAGGPGCARLRARRRPRGVGPRHRSRRPAAQPVRPDGRGAARAGSRDDRGGAAARRGAAQLPAVQVAARGRGARRGRDRTVVLRHRGLRVVDSARRPAEGRAALRRRVDLDAVDDRRRRGRRHSGNTSPTPRPSRSPST